MSNIIQIHPSLRYAQDISIICSPLKKLNITYFAHARIEAEKKFSALSSHPEFTEHYLSNHYYMTDIHRVDDAKFGDFFVWDGIEFTGKSGQMCQEAGEFGIHNPFTIIKRNENTIDYYHFANNSKSKQINQIYLANFELLNLFISHFNEKVCQSKQLKHAYDLTIDIPEVPKISFEDSICYNKEEFLQTIGHDPTRLMIDSVILSKRQTEVLRLIHQGKTLKEISNILHLSYRTVGHYFETIKIKFNVYSRSELISKTFYSLK